MSGYPPELARLTSPAGPGPRVPYGDDPEQFGELWPSPGGPVVVLLHGGFWRARYRLDIMNALAADLQQRGYSVWNLEYRRADSAGGGWPGTFEDISAGVAALTALAGPGPHGLDLRAMTVIGHSAGGHLGLWLAAGGGGPRRREHPRPALTIGLAPVSDLVLAHRLGLSEDAAAGLLGRTPDEDPGRYREASPLALLPLGGRQVIVHGTADDAVPFAMSAGYAAAARAAGDRCDLVELPGGGHLELIDPASAAWSAVLEWLPTPGPAH
ncbi:MAG TPA: alpha/beta hydrolase [Actinocrinis sp.]|nr:alpha/beta hydrolase [Actinocrinis sp.]